MTQNFDTQFTIKGLETDITKFTSFINQFLYEKTQDDINFNEYFIKEMLEKNIEMKNNKEIASSFVSSSRNQMKFKEGQLFQLTKAIFPSKTDHIFRIKNRSGIKEQPSKMKIVPNSEQSASVSSFNDVLGRFHDQFANTLQLQPVQDNSYWELEVWGRDDEYIEECDISNTWKFGQYYNNAENIIFRLSEIFHQLEFDVSCTENCELIVEYQIKNGQLLNCETLCMTFSKDSKEIINVKVDGINYPIKYADQY